VALSLRRLEAAGASTWELEGGGRARRHGRRLPTNFGPMMRSGEKEEEEGGVEGGRESWREQAVV